MNAVLTRSEGTGTAAAVSPIGETARRARAVAADRWLADLFARAACAGPTGRAEGIALAAVGGYGRGSLSPGSDLDVVLLHDERWEPAAVARVAEAIWYPIWDTGTSLDHAVRTPELTRATAARDLQVALGIFDARAVAGEADLVTRTRSAVLADWRARSGQRLAELRDSCAERHNRHGELAFLLEGDLKEARGGLRDAGTLRAISASWLVDVPHGAPEAARALLLDVRDALHTTTGRSGDRLSLADQDAVAELLAAKADPATGELGSITDADTLLRVVSDAARTIAYALDVSWQRVSDVLATRSGRARGAAGRRPLDDGVVAHGDAVVLARAATPARDASLVLRAAGAAARAGMPLAPHALRRLADESAPLPRPWPRRAREAFTALLAAGPALAETWESLDRCGIVTRLLPEWELVRSLPQRNALHTYTVDRHQVEAAIQASALTRRVTRPDLLVTAALFHDLGKGVDPPGHSEHGAALVADLAPALGFDHSDAAVITFLVRHHLLLPETATRRDPDDPATLRLVLDVLEECRPHLEPAEALALLHALTEADARATGRAAWRGWRARMVADLVRRLATALRTNPARAGSTAHETVPVVNIDLGELVARGARERAGLLVDIDEDADVAHVTVVLPDDIGVAALVAGVFALLRIQARAAVLASRDGFAVQVWTVATEYGSLPDTARIVTDLRSALAGTLDVAGRLASRDSATRPPRGTRPAPPEVTVAEGASDVATVLEVRARDTPGLLYRVAHELAAARVDVRHARVGTFAGEAVDVFYVVDQAGRPLRGHAADSLVTRIASAIGPA